MEWGQGKVSAKPLYGIRKIQRAAEAYRYIMKGIE